MPTRDRIRIHGDLISGNCLKVRWVADRVGQPYDWIPIDVVKGEARTAEFLAKFPFGQVPAVETSDGRYLAQSNAIMGYLARDSDLLPTDPWDRAKVDEWLFWEQYNHEPYIAVCRFHMRFLGRSREAWRVERGEQALDLMERRFAERAWLVGGRLTIADIALLAYTRVAHEGGFDLSSRPNTTAWISRCETALGLPSAS